ncbi:hypothetical protein P171DRAFT_435296 [Karstenula rhodostoma CBS 690.94]|uniref:Uncharacterized protein n=1 Tax=Karstenula rhodostoma CBS 690.94 TaxID=1392251 RepID=A0A9P4U8S7_9PLEO|nr:hypothetical protein P171DRAFT_435296 [Karstenula rhodostoma CBS 690.94]
MSISHLLTHIAPMVVLSIAPGFWSSGHTFRATPSNFTHPGTTISTHHQHRQLEDMFYNSRTMHVQCCSGPRL